jgi:hypothetical protein
MSVTSADAWIADGPAAQPQLPPAADGGDLMQIYLGIVNGRGTAPPQAPLCSYCRRQTIGWRVTDGVRSWCDQGCQTAWVGPWLPAGEPRRPAGFRYGQAGCSPDGSPQGNGGRSGMIHGEVVAGLGEPRGEQGTGAVAERQPGTTQREWGRSPIPYNNMRSPKSSRPLDEVVAFRFGSIAPFPIRQEHSRCTFNCGCS